MKDLVSHDGSDKEREDEVRGSVRAVLANGDEAGVNYLINEIASKCSSDKPEMRRESCWMFEMVITERKSSECSTFANMLIDESKSFFFSMPLHCDVRVVLP